MEGSLHKTIKIQTNKYSLGIKETILAEEIRR